MTKRPTLKSATSPFLDPSRWISQNEFAAALRDEYPVSLGHTLVVPKRVVTSIFELSDQEMAACWDLLKEVKRSLDQQVSPNGYNIGVNIGIAAGQTVAHAHIHLIPRFDGDHPFPRGGVRAVIPDKASY